MAKNFVAAMLDMIAQMLAFAAIKALFKGWDFPPTGAAGGGGEWRRADRPGPGRGRATRFLHGFPTGICCAGCRGRATGSPVVS